MHLLPPLLGYGYSSFFFLACPGPPPGIALSFFRRVHRAMQVCFHPLPFSQPPVYLQCSSSSTLGLSASFPILSNMSLTFVSYPVPTPMDSISSCLPRISFHTLSSLPPYSSLPFRSFLPYSPNDYSPQSLSLHVLDDTWPSQFPHASPCSEWVHSQLYARYCITRRFRGGVGGGIEVEMAFSHGGGLSPHEVHTVHKLVH